MRVTIGINRHAITWGVGAIWILAWLGLLLEIYRWHHVTSSLRLNPPPAVPGLPPPKPGGFLITVLAGSAVAPPLFILLVVWDWLATHWNRRARP